MKQSNHLAVGLIVCSTIFASTCENDKRKLRQDVQFYNPLELKDSFVYKESIIQSLLGKINYFDFKGGIINLKEASWYTFLAKDKKTLYLTNLGSSSKIDSIGINISDSLKGKKIILLKDSTLFIYRPSLNNLVLLNWQNGKTRIIKLPHFADSTYYYKEIGFFAIIDKESPKVIFNYGSLRNERTGYLDKENNLIVLDPAKKTFQKIGFYPKEFFKKKKYYTGTIFDTDTAGSIYFTYDLNDSIFRIDKQGKILSRGRLHPNSNFIDFDWSKEENLAYVRKYSSNTELNLYLKVISNERVLIIKQLSNKNILQKAKYKYFLLDSNLRIINADTIRRDVYPRLAYEYKKGFILLSDSLNKAFYYEIN